MVLKPVPHTISKTNHEVTIEWGFPGSVRLGIPRTFSNHLVAPSLDSNACRREAPTEIRIGKALLTLSKFLIDFNEKNC
jgi:hypothetical protein